MSKELEAARALVKMLEEKENAGKVELSTLKPGEVFELAGLKWKVLDITGEGYACLSDKLNLEKKLIKSMIFDSRCNDWKQSNLRRYLNTEFLDEISKAIEVDNIVPFERDLLSLDGQTEYGTCYDRVSLLSADEYRKYRNLIPNTEDYWWWLITAYYTKKSNCVNGALRISPSGYICDEYIGNGNKVRPFCILKSNIYVTKAEW